MQGYSSSAVNEGGSTMIRTLTATAALVCALASGVAAAAPAYPATIQLPNGFRPEGITISENTFYVGSIPTGSVFRGNLRTGGGTVFVQRTGRAAIGLDLDNRGRLFVAGGPTGNAYVYNARTGADVAQFTLAPMPAFINDVVVTRTGAYFTDSTRAALFRVPIGNGGRLGTSVQTIPLTGAFQLQSGFNANGIDATPNGRWLVIAQSNTGKLFRVNPSTGATTEIVLANGETIPSADGILLDGKTLYAVQRNLQEYRVAVIAVNTSLTSGRVVTRIADSRFDVPTTIDELGRRLYVVNARFGTPSPDTAAYQVLQLRKPRGR
jgi:sugar lactone lactonase YvrE